MVSSCTTVMYPEKESDMSFSSEVKEELAKRISPARHCQIAELAALIAFEGRIPVAESENRLLMQKYCWCLIQILPHRGVHW